MVWVHDCATEQVHNRVTIHCLHLELYCWWKLFKCTPPTWRLFRSPATIIHTRNWLKHLVFKWPAKNGAYTSLNVSHHGGIMDSTVTAGWLDNKVADHFITTDAAANNMLSAQHVSRGDIWGGGGRRGAARGDAGRRGATRGDAGRWLSQQGWWQLQTMRVEHPLDYTPAYM